MFRVDLTQRGDRYREEMITGIDHVVLCVADIERSVRWYGEHLGLEPEMLDEWRAGGAPFVSLRVSEGSLIDLLERPGDGSNVDHIAYVTDRGFFDRFVEAHGDSIEMGPVQLSGARGTGDSAYVRDPDGHRIEIKTYDGTTGE